MMPGRGILRLVRKKEDMNQEVLVMIGQRRDGP